MFIIDWQVKDVINGAHSNAAQWLYSHWGEISWYKTKGNAEVIGRFTAHVVDLVQAHKNGSGLGDVLDCADVFGEGITEYADILADQDAFDVSKNVDQAVGKCLENTNVLIIHNIELLPQARHHNIGIDALRHLITRLGSGVGLIVAWPRPAQFEFVDPYPEITDFNWLDLLRLDEFQGSKERGVAKFRQRLEGLGFVPLPGNDLMVAPGPAVKARKAIHTTEQVTIDVHAY